MLAIENQMDTDYCYYNLTHSIYMGGSELVYISMAVMLLH